MNNSTKSNGKAYKCHDGMIGVSRVKIQDSLLQKQIDSGTVIHKDDCVVGYITQEEMATMQTNRVASEERRIDSAQHCAVGTVKSGNGVFCYERHDSSTGGVDLDTYRSRTLLDEDTRTLEQLRIQSELYDKFANAM